MAVYNSTPHHTTPHHTTNFFSPQDNFFIIDSENLSNVTPKFYGFSVQESGIYDRHNITQEALAGLDGTGTYVSVERAGNEIIIRQDFNGCYGLYAYRDGGRFVMSNSFLYLMEYMSRRTRLTLNRDYANHFLIMGLASMAYSETFINEITLLPRDVVVRIDISSGTFSTERVNYGENTMRLNSAEGMKILDDWFAKWTGIIRNLYELTPNIMADLSGGFDSRMAFTLLVNSGIDLSKISVHSIKAKGYTFEEDYVIASEMGRHFGFTLNNMENFMGEKLNYSLDDSLNTAFYVRMFGHNQFLRMTGRFDDKLFRITGHNGETVRTRWYLSGSAYFDFIHPNITRSLSENLRKDFDASTERILKVMIDNVSRKKNAPVDDDLAPNVYRDTLARSHFGTEEAQHATANIYMLNPLADVGLSRLKLDDENCPDKNLLMAIIFTRYCPDLLKFRFTKNESISPDTLKFAEKISAVFPRTDSPAKVHDFSFVSKDPEVSALLERNNPPLEMDAPAKLIKSVFDSSATRKLFATCFDEEIYVYAEEYFRKVIHHPLAKCVTVVATAEVIKHIIISEGTQERNITDDFREFAETGRDSRYDILTGKFIKTCHFTKKAARWIIAFPFRAVRKIIRIIRRK